MSLPTIILALMVAAVIATPADNGRKYNLQSRLFGGMKNQQPQGKEGGQGGDSGEPSDNATTLKIQECKNLLQQQGGDAGGDSNSSQGDADNGNDESKGMEESESSNSKKGGRKN